jgi:L-iditol 2-dehydrogenase
MKAAVIYGTGDIRYEDIEDPKCGAEDVIIHVSACGICGSDSPRILKDWKYPVPGVPGHEFSGKIVEIGKNVKGFSLGEAVVAQPLIPCRQCVHCKSGFYSVCDDITMIGADVHGGYAEYVKVPASNVLKIGGIHLEQAALIEPCAVALYGVLGIEPKMGDTVAILGMGTIGQLVLQWCKIYGVRRVIAVDISEKKLAEAKALGADYCINGLKSDVEKEILELTSGLGVDIAMETAGSKITQEQCLLVTKKRGKVGYLGIARTDILLKEKSFESIFRHELTLKGFWNSYAAPFPGAAWEKSIGYIQDNRIELEKLISHRFPLKDVKEVFTMIEKRSEEYNKILLVVE